MSYRTIKRLLGETSLERKCRFLLGGALMVLITGSFYFYGWQNSSLVRKQNERQHKTTARLLAQTAFLEIHFREFAENETAEQQPANTTLGPIVRSMKKSVTTETFGHLELLQYTATLMKPNPQELPPAERPLLDAEDAEDAWDAFSREATEYITVREEIITNRKNENENETHETYYHFYTPVKGGRSCLGCHNLKRDADQKPFTVGAKMGMVKITFPIEQTDKAFAQNAAILLATAIVTAFLAMLAAAGIVRYVIVKPVLHLKDVSDEITRGNLDLRADIRTADEFEELSHAFNRMLRYLVTAQEELRDVNSDLDGKIDELAQVNLQLYEMNKLKDEFLATMSHELRTPLNSILGFSEVLAGSPNLNDKQGRYVQNIQTSGKELLSLITDVLDLAKIESGKMQLQPVEFSLVDLVERQVGSMMPLAEKKNIDLRTENEPDLPTMFQDPGKLQQILNNLLSNAIKFTPEGGRVRVYAGKADDGMAELVVDDTGIGIPLEEQATIFEKFRQGKEIPGQSDTLTRRYGGTGLGLSIVKELSKLLGGEVTLESEFGKGSTFSIRLPIRLTKEPRQMSDDLLLQRVGVNRAFALDPQPSTDDTDQDAEHDESAA